MGYVEIFCKWKLGNGNLKWKLENGNWEIENGKWKMGHGKWKFEIGIMEIGKWQLENNIGNGNCEMEIMEIVKSKLGNGNYGNCAIKTGK